MWVIEKVEVIWMSFILPILVSSHMTRLKPSTISKNRNGESGHPYLNPLVGFKKSKAYAFIRITKEVEVIHAIINLIICKENLTFMRSSLR